MSGHPDFPMGFDYSPPKLTAEQKKFLLDGPTTADTHQELSNDDDFRRASLDDPGQPPAAPPRGITRVGTFLQVNGKVYKVTAIRPRGRIAIKEVVGVKIKGGKQ